MIGPPQTYSQGDTMNDLISAKGLVKKFGDFTAVDNVDVTVHEGEIYGFLGPNGAGKTTTIRMLTTLLPPTSGSIRINDISIPEGSKEARKLIGIVQQQISLDKDISVRENIIYHAILHKVPKAAIKERLKELSDMMGLTPFLDHTVITLSGGWKRKAAIVCALIHRPKVLFLDEPTAGLDAQSRHALWDMIRRLNKAGTTIFLTTHYMEEAENLCDRVAVINHGRIIALGSPADLCNQIGRITVEYECDNGSRMYRYFPDRVTAKEFTESFHENDAVLTRKTNLEDVFLELTGRKVVNDLVKVVRV